MLHTSSTPESHFGFELSSTHRQTTLYRKTSAVSGTIHVKDKQALIQLAIPHRHQLSVDQRKNGSAH